MTPKETGELLVNAYYDLISPDIENPTRCLYKAKKLAIMCVEQTIDVLGSEGVYGFSDPMVLAHWNQVLDIIKIS